MGITTIQLSEATRNKLLKEKLNEKESYEDVILRILNQGQDDYVLNAKDIEDITASLNEIKKGKYATNKELLKKYDL